MVIISDKEIFQEKKNIFPYDLDSMMDLGIDILLKQPTLLVATPPTEDRGRFINRILNSGKMLLPKQTLYIMVNVISDSFIMSQYHPCKPLWIAELERAKAAVNFVYIETDKRLDICESIGEQTYQGIPIYLFLDSISIIKQKKFEPIFKQVFHILLCARQTNIHTIVFERPSVLQYKDIGYFSSFAMLSGEYREKFNPVVPAEFRDIHPGTFFFSPYMKPAYGKEKIYKI